MAYKMMISMNPTFKLLMQFNTEKKKNHTKNNYNSAVPFPRSFKQGWDHTLQKWWTSFTKEQAPAFEAATFFVS